MYSFGFLELHFISLPLADEDGSEPVEVCLGWSMFPVFHQKIKLGQSGRKTTTDSVRLSLYEGTLVSFNDIHQF